MNKVTFLGLTFPLIERAPARFDEPARRTAMCIHYVTAFTRKAALSRMQDICAQFCQHKTPFRRYVRKIDKRRRHDS